jgi:hypothetical protein
MNLSGKTTIPSPIDIMAKDDTKKLPKEEEEDKELRNRVLIGMASALVASAVAGIGYILWKKRDEDKDKKK